MSRATAASHPCIAALQSALPAGAVLSDPDIVASYRQDQGPLTPAGQPLAVIAPESTPDVSTVLRLAYQHAVVVVPRGAGSGLTGAPNAVDGCLVLSTHRLNQILTVDQTNRVAVVQPGVVTSDLRAAAGYWASRSESVFAQAAAADAVASERVAQGATAHADIVATVQTWLGRPPDLPVHLALDQLQTIEGDTP